MNGTIVNFRRSRTNQTTNHMIIQPDGIFKREESQKLVGKEVIFKTQTGKEIKGKVASSHGNKGCVRAIFEKGMPGQSVGKKVNLS